MKESPLYVSVDGIYSFESLGSGWRGYSYIWFLHNEDTSEEGAFHISVVIPFVYREASELFSGFQAVETDRRPYNSHRVSLFFDCQSFLISN